MKIIITTQEIRNVFGLPQGIEIEVSDPEIGSSSWPMVQADLPEKGIDSKHLCGTNEKSGGGADVSENKPIEKKPKKETAAQVPRAGTLSQDQKQSIIDFKAEGMKPAKIAEKIGCSVVTVYNTIHAYRKAGNKFVEPMVSKEVLIGAPDPEPLDDAQLVEKIKELWVDTEAMSSEVCKELGISMMKFHKLIRDFQIHKTS